VGATGVEAARQALAALYAIVVRQATLLAFIDTFRLFAVVALLCIPSVLLLRSAKARGPIALH
jgi:MFS transporter, DHA2 family, multidrug resistance protein